MQYNPRKETVTLFGASGSMGYEAFKELWKRKEKYNIVVLLLPTRKEKKLFRKYEIETGIKPIPGKGVSLGRGLKIVWGDATDYQDVEEAVYETDWVLNAMALISPQADYYPAAARRVNIDGIKNIIKAIQNQPGGAEHIKYIHTGTVAETGDRLPPIHCGRVGDPLKPSIFDYYAVTKIAGERAVLESDLKYWASLRMTFIMPVDSEDYLSLWDPIMFHQPINSCMENISSRDAGFGLVNCLDLPEDSDFWRGVYNMGGGPKMRCSTYGFMTKALKLGGISSVEAVTERDWFALRNFHMQYYEDSKLTNKYLNYWRDSLEDWLEALREDMPARLKQVALLASKFPFFQKIVENITYRRMQAMVKDHKNGTGYWYHNQNHPRISAFYNDYQTFDSIPDWNTDLPDLVPDLDWIRLDHGYDEHKGKLDLSDLKKAAIFRGGECLSEKWDGDWYQPLSWGCAAGHEFSGKPYTILKGGHWCPECVPPPWDFDREAKVNPFFAQVWYPNHDRKEENFYPEDCLADIAGADE
ncbi:MAG: NAD(P)-dependent oxidoreductase [Anaerolineales bacterium]